MSSQDATALYLCPNCFTPDTQSGVCSMCGHAKVECRPGALDDPCRKPVLDHAGHVLSRAPRWWLEKCVPELMASLRSGD